MEMKGQEVGKEKGKVASGERERGVKRQRRLVEGVDVRMGEAWRVFEPSANKRILNPPLTVVAGVRRAATCESSRVRW